MALVAFNAKDVKNSLYVRNLSPNVTESVLREVFGQIDDIENVVFRAFPNSNNQFFAQIDFKTSKGVAQGSRLNGTPIMGAACQVGVIDPLAQKVHQDMELAKYKANKLGLETPATASASSVGEAPEEPQTQQQYIQQQKEALEDQNFRTVHMTGFEAGVTDEALKAFCEHFGEVVSCRVEEPGSISPYALVEFKERGPASIVKTQKTYEVDGRIVTFSESKTMVEAERFAEQSVHFQLPIYDHMAMKHVLATQGQLNAKLAKVREAAMSMKIGQKDSSKEAEDSAEQAPSIAAIQKSLKEKEKKRDRSRSKRQKKDAKDEKKKKEEKKDKKDKKRRREASKSRSVSKPRSAPEEALEKEPRKKKRSKVNEGDASEKESPKKKKKKAKLAKEKTKEDESAKDDASEKATKPKKKVKGQKQKKKKEASEEASEKKKVVKTKKKKAKMALATEEDEEQEEKPAPEGEAAQKDESDGESSSAPVDLEDPDGVDFVYGAEKIALSSTSSSSSSSSKSSVNPEELQITGVDHGLDIVATDLALEFIAQKTSAVDLNDRSDAVEFVKTLPLGSPAVTTPGDISSTDSSSDSSDSPVREVAGEVSDGEGTTSGAKKRPPLPAIRRRPSVMRGGGRGGRRRIPVKATIGLDGVLDDGGAVASDDNVDGGEVASDDDVVASDDDVVL